LGTDGFGRSDSRKELRYFFEVNANYIVFVTLKALVDDGLLESKTIKKAIKKLNIDIDKSNPMHS
jgi:pyruvate dehydrogenase E1 component